MLVGRGVGVERLRAVDDDGGELFVKVFENLLGETSADVANGLIGLASWVVAGEEERAINRSSFTLAVVGS